MLFESQSFVCGQDKQSIEFIYGQKAKESGNYKTNPVFDKKIEISPKDPLIIKSPNQVDIFNIYVMSVIFEHEDFDVYLTGGDSPFTPKIVTLDKGSRQIGELQLIGNYGESRPGYEPFEEARVISESEIILTAKISLWKLDSKGDIIKRSKKVREYVDKYRITDKGTFEKIQVD